eukprot:Phypoly_transcript_23878.p1 GENE.Phypoly_transcript_23878~~Phypoly_transcript_23878.p1  ORF type:complete len:125 (+),score=25.72 Phypoly_transcript_23878:119-493(+)
MAKIPLFGMDKHLEQAIVRFLVDKLSSSRLFQQFAVTTHLLAKHAKEQGTKTIQEAIKKAQSSSSSSTKYFSSTSTPPSSYSSSYSSYSQHFNHQQTFNKVGNTFLSQFISRMRRNLTKMITKK